MTFEEISHAWDISSFNVDNSKLALRTFHNHREAINSLFGIKILCNRSDHNYYIEEENTNNTNLKLWMLQYLSILPIIKKEGEDVADRIIMDETPEQKYGLSTLIHAMKKNRTITFTYPSDTESGLATVEAEPFALRFFDHTWYILGKDVNKDKLRMFGLPLVTDLKITKNKFKLPSGFSASGFFGRYAGLDINTDAPEETIKIKVTGDLRGKLKTKPLHITQKEIMASDDYSIFEIKAIPTADFLCRLIRLGRQAEIIEPVALREKMIERIENLVDFLKNK